MLKWLKNIFNIQLEVPDVSDKLTIKTIDTFDTVWIKKEDVIQKGWIYEKTKKRIVVVSENDEYIFHYGRPYDRDCIEQNKIILYFNNPC